jgi:hypothetical protein
MRTAAIMITNRSDSPIGPLGSNKTIVLQPARKVTAPRAKKPTKGKYLFLFIYPPHLKGQVFEIAIKPGDLKYKVLKAAWPGFY